MRNPTPSILMVMGTGRSGSTIMDVVLSNNDNVVGCGELGHIFEDAFRDRIVCSCGETASDCDFWGKVLAEMALDEGEVGQTIDVFHNVEWHSRFFIALAGLVPKADMATYRDVNHKLFQAIKLVSGAKTIVDSSKYPGRALGLSRILGDELRIIYLTRNPDGLMSSFQKSGIEQNTKTSFQVFVYYSVINIMARCVAFLTGKRCMHVAYEDFIQSPIEQLERIERWAGVDLSRSKKLISENGELSVSHIMRGNRLRKSGTVRFRSSLSPVGAMSGLTRFYSLVMQLIKTLLRI